MGSQLWINAHQSSSMALLPMNVQLRSLSSLPFSSGNAIGKGRIFPEAARRLRLDPKTGRGRGRRGGGGIIASSSNAAGASLWDGFGPDKSASAPAPSLSDVLWPAAGAFAAMAMFGKIDQILAPKGLSITIAPLGAVTAVLLTTPSSPGARKYNMFVAQVGCAAAGVLALTVFGPGWLARAVGLAASIAFMVYTRAIHPPAASLPILFIDAVKLQNLNYWYAVFPGATGCILLCLIQEIVCYLKENVRF